MSKNCQGCKGACPKSSCCFCDELCCPEIYIEEDDCSLDCRINDPPHLLCARYDPVVHKWRSCDKCLEEQINLRWKKNPGLTLIKQKIAYT